MDADAARANRDAVADAMAIDADADAARVNRDAVTDAMAMDAAFEGGGDGR